jgi:hypothetical protein
LADDAAVRSRILNELRPLEALSRFHSRHIFQAIFALEDAAEPVGFAAVHARLEEPDQNLLAEAVLNEDEEIAAEAVEAAIESVRHSDGQQQRDQLKARIRESERAGKWEEALRLMAELETMVQSARRA